MREGWKYVSFEKSINKVKKQKSVKSKDYKEKGIYPIVSQESALISGYCDDESLLFRHSNPIVIFGDHTKNIKYIDFDFVVGADGVHILSPIEIIFPKFFYYQLCSIKLRNLGYARHYKLLKQSFIAIPPLYEQERIVSLLDLEFAKIDAIKANAEKQLQDAKDLFQSALKDLLTPKEGWKEKNIVDICSDIFAGGDAPKDRKKEKEKDYKYPIYSNGIEQKGLYGFTNTYRVNKPSITIAARGTIGVAFIRMEPFTPIVRLVTLIPDLNVVDINFLCYLIQGHDWSNTGAAIPQLTIPMVKDVNLYLPTLVNQQLIAEKLDSLSEKVKQLQSSYEKTITLCNDLKQSIFKDIFG